MQLPEDCVRTRSSPPPSLSLSLSSLALCLAGFSPFLARSRSGPVGTSYNTTSATFCKKDWAWISWAWTCTMAVDSSKKSTSMSGWVLGMRCGNDSRCFLLRLSSCGNSPCAVFVELVHPLPVSQLRSSTTTISNVIGSLHRPAPRKAHMSSRNWAWLKTTTFGSLRLLSERSYLIYVWCTIFYIQSQQQLSSSGLYVFLTVPSVLQAVNELLESLGAPLEIVDGFVSSIAVTIPWQALLTDHCTLEVSGLQITCRPKYRTSEFSEKQLPLSNYRLPCFRCSASCLNFHTFPVFSNKVLALACFLSIFFLLLKA